MKIAHGRIRLKGVSFGRNIGGEQGQVIVLVVLMLAGLIGFAALAVDGGNYYSHRRIAQNASDAGALAGAFKMASSSSTPTELQLLIAIQDLVEANNIIDSSGVSGDGVNTHIRVFYTLADGSDMADGQDGADFNCDGSGNCLGIDGGGVIPTSILSGGGIRVVVNYTLDTFLAGFIGLNTLPVEAFATATFAAGPSGPPFNGRAVVSLTGSDCDALKVTGGASLQTIGGGIHVNSNARSKNCHAARATGGGTVDGGSDGIFVVGDTDTSGGSSFSTPLTEYPNVSAMSDPFASMDPPESTCGGGAINHSDNGSSDVIGPGHYSQIKRTGGSLTMTAGIYCIESSNANKGFEITGSSTVTGSGVLIYLKYGNFSTSGSSTINLSAITNGDYAGFVVFSNVNNSSSNSDIEMSGGSGTNYTGTIYAPSNDCVVTGGSENIGIYSQLICKTVTATGTGNITVNYDPDQNYQQEVGSVSLNK